MTLISMRNVRLAFGGPPVLEDVSLQIKEGERICLLGRNGAGKSSLLALIGEDQQPDSGVIERRQGLRTAILQQQIPKEMNGSVLETILGGLGAVGELISHYRNLSRKVDSGDENRGQELGAIHHDLGESDGMRLLRRIEELLVHLGLEKETPILGLPGA